MAFDRETQLSMAELFTEKDLLRRNETDPLNNAAFLGQVAHVLDIVGGDAFIPVATDSSVNSNPTRLLRELSNQDLLGGAAVIDTVLRDHGCRPDGYYHFQWFREQKALRQFREAKAPVLVEAVRWTDFDQNPVAGLVSGLLERSMDPDGSPQKFKLVTLLDRTPESVGETATDLYISEHHVVVPLGPSKTLKTFKDELRGKSSGSGDSSTLRVPQQPRGKGRLFSFIER
jgi:hypothetical protein